MEQHSARMSRHSEQQAVPAARRPKPARPLRAPRPAREARSARRPPTDRSAGERPGAGRPALRVPRFTGPAGLAARLPQPRLTGLGAGVLAVLAMLLLGGLDALLFDGHAPTYGVLFLLVSAATAVWVRPADLVAPPVAAPLAFTAGLFLIIRTEGFGDTVMGMFTGLSVLAGWVYGGTLLAGVIVLVRRVRLVARRRSRRADRPGTAGAPDQAGRPENRP